MKAKLKYLSCLLLLVVIVISCGKDKDDGSTPTNYLKVDGEYYELSYGYQEDWGTGDYYAGNNVDVVLISDGITIDFDTYDVTGVGNVIYFEFFTAGDTGIGAGEYVYADSEPYATGTFDDGEYLVNFDVATEEAEDSGYFTGGTITVKRSGSVYEIAIDAIDSSGKKITGYYKGPLILVDVESYFMMSTEDLERDQFQIMPDVY